MYTLLLHGFASSGKSNKARAIRDHIAEEHDTQFHALEFAPSPRDFEFMTITGMINRVRQYVLDQGIETAALIGSSLGALVALHYAQRYGNVGRMLLLAPALRYNPDRIKEEDLATWKDRGSTGIFHLGFNREIPLRFDFHSDGMQYVRPVPPSCPSVIVHGTEDDVIPVSSSRKYVSTHADRVGLVEVASDHRLLDSMGTIFEQIDTFLLSETGSGFISAQP